MDTLKWQQTHTADRPLPRLGFDIRTQLSPLIGVAFASFFSLLPQWFTMPEVSAWAAVSLLMGFVYFALLPNCKRGWSGILLGVMSIAIALTYQSDLSVLHLWVCAQTVLAGLWMLRAERQIELTTAGLILGLNAGASFFMMH